MKIIRKWARSLLLAAAMVFTMLPFGTLTASAADATDSGAIRLDAANSFGITGGGTNWIYYGDYSGSPVKWRVLSTEKNGESFLDDRDVAYSGNGLFLLSEYLFDDNKVLFSDMESWIDTFYTDRLTSKEKNALLQTTKTSDTSVEGYWNASNLSGDRLFSLSAAESRNTAYFKYTTDRAAYRYENTSTKGFWLLRSPSIAYPAEGALIDNDGNLRTIRGINAGVRPAFNLNLSSVLFASAAQGGKSAAGMESALTVVSADAPTEWKLTLRDGSRAFAAMPTANAFVPTSGGTVPIVYWAATAGTNEYVSAMLVDGSGTPLYYGRIKAVNSPDGTAAIAIPSGLAEGDYTLSVFSEQYNGDKVTDYASDFSNITLTVSDSYITPATAAFDKNSPADVTITKTDGTRTLSNIWLDGLVLLTPDTHYTVSDNTVTIKKEFLENLSEGLKTLTFDYGMPVNPTLEITVRDTAASIYGAFGDSIATGYGLAGYTPGMAPDDAYVSIVGNALGGSRISLAMDGLTSSTLLSYLSIPGPVLSQQNIVFTLSIGSDDVLLPFLNIVAQEFGCDPEELQSRLADLAQNDQATLAAALAALNADDGTGLKNNTELQNAASGFAANFQAIISKLKAYAPNATIYVTNIYNPYEGISIPYGVGMLELGKIADTYIKTMNGAFDAGSADYTLIDTYSTFSASLAGGTAPVNANPASFNFDPHPNKAGHALIANMILAYHNGTITGTVRDSGGYPISGAVMSLTVSGSVYSATTAADGSYSIANVPIGTGYTVTAGKPGYTGASVTGVEVMADATTSGVDITLTSDEDGCVVTYKGAQVRYNEDSQTYDIRFIAIIDTLNAEEVGFVFSKAQEIPTRENASARVTSTVYTAITASGLTVTAESLGGTYIIACTVTGIPAGDIDVPFHVRAFSTIGTVTKYTPVVTVTVNDVL